MKERSAPVWIRWLVPAVFAWALAGLVLWSVEVARHGYAAHGEWRLLFGAGAGIYRSVAPAFLASALLWLVLLAAARALPVRRRARSVGIAVGAAGLGAWLHFAFRINRYGFTGFWKEVRNTRSVPWEDSGSVILGNACLAGAVIIAVLVLRRIARPLVLPGGEGRGIRVPGRLASAALIGPLAAFAAGLLAGGAPRGAVNVLVIALDTTRNDHLTLAGYPRETAPALTRLASDGSLFVRTLSQAPWTLSSFASLMTGLYPSTHGAYIGTEVRRLSRDYVPYLPKSRATLAEIFKDRGYATLCEATNTYLRFGLQQGYDSWRVQIRPAGETTDAFLDELERVEDRPFFAFLHFNDAHIPNRPPAPYDRIFPTSTGRPHSNEEIWEWRFTDGAGLEGEEFEQFREHKIAVYDGCIRYMDDQIGRVLARLEDRGLDERTVVAVVTDHGEEFWDHAAQQAAAYRDPRGLYGVGHGHTLFDEQLRLLLVFRGPGVPAGGIFPHSVRAIDLAPTLLCLAGIDTPRQMEGASLAPFFTGEEREDRAGIAEAVVFGPDRRALVRDDWKYVWSPDEPHMLFNLEKDPAERADLLAEEPGRAAAMRAEIEAWIRLHEGKGPEIRGALDDETLEELKALGYIEK
ncbi:MAG: sulfatase [Candidatus Eisenbacteria bacterium]